MPHAENSSTSPMADIVTKIIDLQDEINSDIDKLVDLKREIVEVIKAVDCIEFQTILEKRYLCFMPWEQIALDMNYEMRYLYKVHNRALGKIKVPA